MHKRLIYGGNYGNLCYGGMSVLGKRMVPARPLCSLLGDSNVFYVHDIRTIGSIAAPPYLQSVTFKYRNNALLQKLLRNPVMSCTAFLLTH